MFHSQAPHSVWRNLRLLTQYSSGATYFVRATSFSGATYSSGTPFLPQPVFLYVFGRNPQHMEADSHSGIYPPLTSTRRVLTSDSDALFWEAIFSVDVTSAEGLSKIVALVHSPSQITMARSLRDDQAQAFVDLIDRVSDSGRHPSVPRILIMRYSSSRYPVLTRNYLGGAHNYYTRFAKPVGFYPPRISLRQSSQMLVSFGGAVALQTSAKEGTRDGPWPSST